LEQKTIFEKLLTFDFNDNCGQEVCCQQRIMTTTTMIGFCQFLVVCFFDNFQINVLIIRKLMTTFQKTFENCRKKKILENSLIFFEKISAKKKHFEENIEK